MPADPTLPRESDPVEAAWLLLVADIADALIQGDREQEEDIVARHRPAIEAAIRSRPVEEGWTDQRIAEVFGGRFEDGMWQGAEWSIQGIVEEMGPALRAARPVEVDPERLRAALSWMQTERGMVHMTLDRLVEAVLAALSSPEPRKP